MRIPNPGHVKRGRELPRVLREINIIIHYLSLSKQLTELTKINNT